MCDTEGQETAAPSESLEDQIVVAQDTLQEVLEMLGEAWAENEKLRHELKLLRTAKYPPGSTPAAPGPKPASTDDAPAAKQQREGVLIIDDSKILQMRITSLIEPLGYKIVGVAADGAAGVKRALALKPQLIILDYMMPVLNGLECLKLIRQQDREAKVIICASDLTRELSQAFLQAGTNDIVAKPINLEKFVAAVRRCMDEGN